MLFSSALQVDDDPDDPYAQSLKADSTPPLDWDIIQSDSSQADDISVLSQASHKIMSSPFSQELRERHLRNRQAAKAKLLRKQEQRKRAELSRLVALERRERYKVSLGVVNVLPYTHTNRLNN